MDAPEPESRAVEDVPLFPLPSTVLFPRVRQPFYVFEPRYRAMLRDVLDGAGRIGFPLLVAGGGPRPEISGVFGIGEVVRYETHADGTSDLLVLGRDRARLIEELPAAEYRRARVTLLPEHAPDPGEEEDLRATLAAKLMALDRVGISPEARDALAQILKTSEGDVTFLVHVLCTIMIGSPEVRQKLLEEDRVADRGRGLATLLETFRQELSRTARRERPE